MIDTGALAFMELVVARRGHFRLESGHHSGLWLDLDPLFTDTRRIEPLVHTLTALIQPYDVTAVCGPLLGGAFLAQLVAGAIGAEFWFTERSAAPKEGGMYRAQYSLPAALARRASGHRVAMVDDVMSAGSALRGTYAELRAHGAVPVVAAALLVLGTMGADYFAERQVPVQAVGRDEYELWDPAHCPMCRDGHPVEDSIQDR